MSETPPNKRRIAGSSEARRLAEVARAAGLGDSPDAAVKQHQTALGLLGADEPSPLYADVLRWQGTVLRDRGRTSDAEPLYRRSLALSRELKYEPGIAHALNCLAGLAQRRGDINAAGVLLTEALTLAEGCGETRLVGMIQANLGIIADIRGNGAVAEEHYRVALHTFEATHDQQQLCGVLVNLGYLYLKEERFDDADGLFVRGLGIARSRGDLLAEGLFEENRAELRLMRGETEEAYPSIARALEVADRRTDDVRKAAALKLQGAYQRMCGRTLDSADTLRHALTLAAVGEDALLGGEILYQFGLALHAGNDTAMASEVWTAALEAFERIAARQWVGRVRDRLTAGPTGRYL